MENQDKLYTQFKNAAEKSEAKEFPNMDSVWNRVEQKLDTKVLKKETKIWKKIAVAASILLVFSVLYQFLKSDEKINFNENKVVVSDSISVKDQLEIKPEKAVVSTEVEPSEILKNNADEILKKEVSKTSEVATTYKSKSTEASSFSEVNADVLSDEEQSDEKKNGLVELKNRKFSAIGVTHEAQKETAVADETAKKASQISAKSEPILIIDNKAITSKDGSNYKTISKDEMAKIKSDDLETVIYLKEPLYIIDGKQYSEEELFGAKPTSPYAPLNEQEIKTTKVLQGEEALAAYGEKGAKGVLIITTKNGRPFKKE